MDKEIQRQILLVQLKILKELRILNQNYADAQDVGYKLQSLDNRNLNDVRDAIALTGRNFI